MPVHKTAYNFPNISMWLGFSGLQMLVSFQQDCKVCLIIINLGCILALKLSDVQVVHVHIYVIVIFIEK